MSCLAVGLTGGIASGKSLVSQLFAHWRVTVIDADIIARQLVAPGQEAHHSLLSYFGPSILNADNSLNRPKLRQLMLTEAGAKDVLEATLHPRIRAEMARQLSLAASPYAILAIPLLVETLPNPLLNRVLVVDCSEALQLQRVQQRDGSSSEQAQQLVNLQTSRKQRLQYATEVIINDGDLNSLTDQVQQLHYHYCALTR